MWLVEPVNLQGAVVLDNGSINHSLRGLMKSRSRIAGLVCARLMVAVFLSLCSLASVLDVWAAPAGFDQAVRSYKTGQYGLALARFQIISQANPADASAHYYMGLCYQCLNQLGFASQQYRWVTTYSSDLAYKSQAQQALQQLGRVNRNYQGHGNPTQVAYGGGRPKVIEFYTTWCGYCKQFEPEFQNIQSLYRGRVDFDKQDAEDPSNQSMVDRYNVHHFPTFLFFDSAGKFAGQSTGADGNTVVNKLNQLTRK